MLKKTLNQIIHAIKVRGKPLCIHCEAQHIPKFQQSLNHFLLKHNVSLYCITPVNKTFVEAHFGKVTDNFSRELERTYLSLLEIGHSINLHVHLTVLPNLLSCVEKERMICDAHQWMVNIGLKPTELVLGWFNKEDGIEEISQKLGLRLVRESEQRTIHDYQL